MLVKLVISKWYNGADVNVPTIYGETPLMMAYNHANVLEYLRNHGAGRDSEGNTPLMYAVSSGNTWKIFLSPHDGYISTEPDNIECIRLLSGCVPIPDFEGRS